MVIKRTTVLWFFSSLKSLVLLFAQYYIKSNAINNKYILSYGVSSRMLSNKKLKVAMIELVGGHGGLDIYDLGVCNSIVDNDCKVVFYTCDKTKGYALEKYFNIKRYFKGIYGKGNSLIRFILFLKGLTLTFFDIKKSKPDIIYLHIFTFSLIELFVLLMSLIFSVKIFVNIHDPLTFGNKSNYYVKRFFLKLLYLHKVCVTTHTSYSRSVLLESFPSLPVLIMPYSDIDNLYDEMMSKEDCKKKLDLDIGLKYVLFFGQIKSTKGLDTLLKSWAAVALSDDKLRLLVVGRCYQHDCNLYKKIINDEGIQDSVIWNEFYVEDADVPCFFRASDLIVLPYTRIYSSAVLIRAVGYGTPLIVSDQSAFTEIIENNLSAIVFNTGDSSDLSNKLINAFKNESILSEMSDNAKMIVGHKHSWDRIGKEMKHIFWKSLSE